MTWTPQLGPQNAAIDARRWCHELFYGGAVFGGKTDLLLGDFASDLSQGRNWKGIIFRKTHPELEEIIDRSNEIYPSTGGEYLVGKSTWNWPHSGAVLRLRHLESETDYTRYMGHSFSWIGWDELPEMRTMTPYKRMKARLRGAAHSKRIRATGNPGGHCHNELKKYFGIGSYPLGMQPMRDPKSKMIRMFIPARLQDNLIGLRNDPDYPDRLEGLGDPELVRAWKLGDWNAIIGNYFAMFDEVKCTVDPFAIPQGWRLTACLDYGEENATWCGILATDFDDDVWVVDEYYRAGAGGLDHARAIKAMIANCPYIAGQRVSQIMAPHDMWTKRKPGEAALSRSPADSFREEGLHLTRANMDRINGWRNCKDLLYSNRLHFFRGRTQHVVSSIGTVSRSTADPEDVEKGGDDHPADGLRYGINHVYKPRKRIVHDTPIDSGDAILQLLTPAKKSGRYG
jgi:hypothetical protein